MSHGEKSCFTVSLHPFFFKEVAKACAAILVVPTVLF